MLSLTLAHGDRKSEIKYIEGTAGDSQRKVITGSSKVCME